MVLNFFLFSFLEFWKNVICDEGEGLVDPCINHFFLLFEEYTTQRENVTLFMALFQVLSYHAYNCPNRFLNFSSLSFQVSKLEVDEVDYCISEFKKNFKWCMKYYKDYDLAKMINFALDHHDLCRRHQIMRFKQGLRFMFSPMRDIL